MGVIMCLNLYCSTKCKDKSHQAVAFFLLLFMPIVAIAFIAMKYVDMKQMGEKYHECI